MRERSTAAKFPLAVALFVLMQLSLEPAEAQARLVAASIPCATLQSAVRQGDGAVIHTSPYLYERYVPFCGSRQREIPAFLSSRDNSRCLVGYTCSSSSGN
jgi:hypothetical protein